MALVRFVQTENLGEIVIDSPPLNLFSSDLLEDLRTAVNSASASSIRALLLRADGDDFSAGADTSIFTGLDEAGARRLEDTVVSLIAAIEALPVPAVAVIHGQCYAGALEVCLACDLLWAAEGSQIGQIEAVAGSIPYAGGTGRIASRIGAARAAEMVFTAAVLGPETLQSWGLVNRVVPAGSIAQESRVFAQTLADGPTRAYAATKRVLHAWRSGGVAAADSVTHAEGPLIMTSKDTQEGIASLAQFGPGHAKFNGV